MKISCTVLALTAALLVGTAHAEDTSMASSISAKLRGSNCNYKCPSHSTRKDGRNCYNNFDDCLCDYGYEKKYGKCVYKKTCFECPANSHEVNSKFCGQSFHDSCVCNYGFEKKHGKCVYKNPCFKCPANSHEVNSKFCGQSFHDSCVCNHGYERKNGKCGKECHNDFQCPAYSTRKHNRNCYDSFDDCKCDYGYERKNGKCVKECHNDFQCPAHSTRKHNRNCYDSFNDCKCDYGYERKNGKCVREEYIPQCYTRYLAYLDPDTRNGAETRPYGALELDQQYRELNFFGEYRNLFHGAALEGHKMHIHNDPVVTQGDCASTGGHYDPTGVEVEGYNCDPEFPSTCYVGDLTGKFGKVRLDGEETTIGQYRFDIQDVLGRGVVLHDPGTGARIACGTIEKVTVCE